MKITVNGKPLSEGVASDVIGWMLVGISFLGGAYICWVFGHSLAPDLSHFIISLF